MKIDNYTKGILTVICFCLLVIAAESVGVFPEANASDLSATSRLGYIPINEDGSISVKLIGATETIDVNIEDADRYAFRYCTVPVDITNQPIEVEIE